MTTACIQGFEFVMWQIRWITIYKNNDLNHERTVSDSYSMLYKIKAKMSCWHLWHHYIAFSSLLYHDVCHYSDIFNQSRHFVLFANFTTTRCKAKNLKATVLATFCLKFWTSCSTLEHLLGTHMTGPCTLHSDIDMGLSQYIHILEDLAFSRIIL